MEYAADTLITTDGNGNLSLKKVLLTSGSITRIAFGFASVTTTGTIITHNFGVGPSLILATVAGLGGVTYYVTNYSGLNTFTITSSANCSMWWLAMV